VYFLTGINPQTGRPRVYIGEAEIIRDRLKRHLERDFWKTVIFFVSKDENLTKAHVKYLEGKIIRKAKEAERFELANANSSGSHLPESDSADMDVFFEKVEQLLPVLGQDFLKPITKPGGGHRPSGLLVCRIKNVEARGRPTENGFLVVKGSEAVLKERPSVKKYPYPATLRAQLLSEEILKTEPDKLVFVKDYEFTSPSAAASVVHGGHANGLKEWVDTNGVLLKDREQKQVARNVIDTDDD
jgi:hypothetical protein